MRSINIKAYTTLILASLLWFLGKFVRYAYPPLFETLQTNYGISNAIIGMVYTGLLTVYALLQFPSGVIADRIGSVQVVVAGGVLASVGSLLMVFNSPLFVLVIAMLLIGAGTGVHKTVSVQVLSVVYTNKTGRTLGIFDTFGSYGGVGASFVVTAFLVVPPILESVVTLLPGEAWRGVFLFSGVAGLLLAGGFGVYVPKQLNNSSGAEESDEESEQDDAPTPKMRDYLKQLTKPRFFMFLLAATMFSFTYNGAVAFLPLYLSEGLGLENTVANLLYSLVFAVSVVQIVTGDISDRLGRLPIMMLMLGLSGIALLISTFLQGDSIVLIGAIIVSFAVGTHGFRPVRGVYLVEILPDRIVSGGFGIVRTILMVVGAISPPIVGYIADLSNFRVAFGFLSISMLIGATLCSGLLVLEQTNYSLEDGVSAAIRNR
jgi:MFS family permease